MKDSRAVEAPRCRAVVSELISWANKLGSCITMLSGMEGNGWAAEWYVTVIFHNCESRIAFYCYSGWVLSGRVFSSFLPWALYSCSVPERSMWPKPINSLFGEIWGGWAPCGKDWMGKGETSQYCGLLLASSSECAECWHSVEGEGRMILMCVHVCVFSVP